MHWSVFSMNWPIQLWRLARLTRVGQSWRLRIADISIQIHSVICFSIPLTQGKLGNFFPAGLQLVT